MGILSTIFILGIVPTLTVGKRMIPTISLSSSFSSSSPSKHSFPHRIHRDDSSPSTTSTVIGGGEEQAGTVTSPGDPNCPLPPRVLYPLPFPYPSSLLTVLDTINETTYSTLNTAVVNSGGGGGYSYQIYYGNQILSNISVGKANRSANLPWSSTTPSRIASVSKVFSTILLVQFISRGYIVSWNGQIIDSCPSFGIRDPFTTSHQQIPPDIDNLVPTGGMITWKHLSTHLSGIQREIVAGFNTTDEALQYMNDTLLIQPPDTVPSYSNVAFSILGHLLANCVYPQTVEGMQYLQSLNLSNAYNTSTRLVSETVIDLLPYLVQRYIIDPLGLSHTYYYNTSILSPSLLQQLAVGYLPDGTSIPSDDYNLYWGYPAGLTISCADDLIFLQQELLYATVSSSNRLNISTILARELFQPVVRVGDGSYLQGIPWEIRPRGINYTSTGSYGDDGCAGCASFTVFSKGGNLPGYTALIATVPAWNITIAGLFNGNVDEFGWSDMLMDNLLPTLATLATNEEPFPNGNPGPRTSLYYQGLFTNSQGFGEVDIVPVENSILFKYIEPSGGVISFFLNYFSRTTTPLNNEESGKVTSSFFRSLPTVFSTVLLPDNATVTLDIFQASLPPFNQLPSGSFDCADAITLGLLGQYIFFYINNVNSTYSVPIAVTMPGFIPGAVFTLGR